jgi:ADP-L-glycero-D-manno-heptose 6-epimerase
MSSSLGVGQKNGFYIVTGAAGFVGARFVESCNEKGIPVVSVDKTEYFTERTEHSSVAFGEIVDRENLMEWLEKLDAQGRASEIRGIVHLGACANTMEADEAYLLRMNVEYSQKLWNFASKHKIPMIYASSAATYGDGAQGYDDDESKIPTLKPLNLYGESKQKFDVWALEQEKKGNHPPTWAGFKFFNVYGFGERHKGRMASVILHSSGQIKSQGFVRLFKSHRAGIADGHQKRDFVFVGDVVSVLHFALDHPLKRGIFNLGTGQARTFLDLTRAVFKALHREEKIEFIDTPIEIRDKYQYFTEANMQKLKAAGYVKPFTSLEDGVKQYLSRL